MHDSTEHVSQNQSPQSGGAFQQHLDGLYRFAQALTLDEVRAATLVEEACRRAAFEFPAGIPPDEEQRRLYQLLVASYRDMRTESVSDSPLDGAPAPDSEAAAEEDIPNYRRRVAEQILERILPVAVTALPDDLRALLLLCDVDGMPCERAADVLGVEPETTCRKLEEAHRRVYDAVYAGATGHERQLLAASLPSDWVRASLQQVLRSEFAPLPSSLRTSVDDIVAVAGAAPEAAPDASEHPSSLARRYTPPPRRNQKARLRGVIVAVALVLVTGLMAYLISRQVSPGKERNLVTLAAQQASDVEIDVQTASPEDAERYVQDTFGLRLTLPEIEQAQLRGVGINEVTPGVKMPVFYYEDEASGESVVLFAYSYALLDRNRDRVTLAADILKQIEDDEHFDLHDLGTEKVLVWRNRDDIFVAVTRGDAESLRERILFPS